MPYLVLPASHYAAQWSADREIREVDQVTQVAVNYIRETNPAKKQELLLELVRYFHSYVFKYVSMIVSGCLPKAGNHINKDVKIFLKFFLPAGEKPSTNSFCAHCQNAQGRLQRHGSRRGL